MATLEIDEELLQPTLTEADEVSGFHAPWNPWSVLLVMFLAGPAFGTVALAWNAARLGLRRQVGPVAGGGVLATALGLASLVLFFESSASPEQLREAGRQMRFVMTLLGAGLWLLVARSHQRRFRLYTASGGEPGSLFLVGALLVAARILLTKPLLVPLMVAILELLHPGPALNATPTGIGR